MIRFNNVRKTYPNGTQALKGLSFELKDGEFAFLVGPSGAGKSTILSLLTAEEPISGGSLMVNGYNLNTIRPGQVPYLRRSLGIVFQDFRLIPKKTVYENMAFAMRVVGASPREMRRRIPYVLDLVGLTGKENNMPDELSGGEQQRVAIARALVNNPSTIIADEPTGNLDPDRSMEIMSLLERINALGTTMLVVTHEKGLVNHFNKRVIHIEDGVVARAGRRGGRFLHLWRRQQRDRRRDGGSTKSNNFRYYVSEGFKGLFSHGFMSAAAIIIIAACLLITGSFSLVAVNIEYNLSKLMEENEFLAYVQDDYTEEQAQALQSRIESIDNVATVTFISRQEAKDTYLADIGADNALYSSLPDNVLRDRYSISVTDISQLSDTIASVRQVEGIADISAALDVANGFIHRAQCGDDRQHCPGGHSADHLPVHRVQRHQAGHPVPSGGDRHYEDVRRDQWLYPHAVRV